MKKAQGGRIGITLLKAKAKFIEIRRSHMIGMTYKKQLVDVLAGKEVPTTKKELLSIQEKLTQLKGLQIEAKDYLVKTIGITSSLGHLEMEIQDLNGRIEGIMDQLTEVSEA